MLKRIGLTFILLILLGCSNLPKNEVPSSPKEQVLIQKINKGEISEAVELLDKISVNLEPEKVKNYQTMISERDLEVKDLEKLIKILKDAFSKNHFFIVERYTDIGIKNKIKLNELKKLDLSQGNFYTGKPVFDKDQASVLAIINFYDESLYLDIFFSRKSGEWKIINFNERGGNIAR